MDIGNLMYAFFNSPGPGGILASLVLGGALLLYIGMARWILNGGKRRR